MTGSLEWADGDETFRHIVVPIAADKVAEDSEAFRVELHDASGGVTIGSAQADVSISDDDDGTPGFIDVSRRPSPVLESDGSVMLRFTRVFGSTGPVSVTFSTIPVTASEPADYAATSGTVSWADGESGAKEVAVAIADDSMIEIPEIFDTDIFLDPGAWVSIRRTPLLIRRSRTTTIRSTATTPMLVGESHPMPDFGRPRVSCRSTNGPDRRT